MSFMSLQNLNSDASFEMNYVGLRTLYLEWNWMFKYGTSTSLRGTPWSVVFHEFTVLEQILSNFNGRKESLSQESKLEN